MDPAADGADRNLGDGDHGIGMSRGMNAVKEKLGGADFASVDKVFGAAGIIGFGDAAFLDAKRLRRVETGLKRLLTLLEPALIVVLGVLVAGIIVSILLGILSINEIAV